MEIITLVGKPNTGKTSTLKEVILKLAGKNGENLLDVSIPRGCKTFIGAYNKEKLSTLREKDGDVFVNLQYGSVKIGISTAGDRAYDIEHKFKILKDHCDYFICASRNTGKSFEYIEKLGKDYKVTKLYKVGCIGDETASIYNTAINYVNGLSIIEIFENLENL